MTFAANLDQQVAHLLSTSLAVRRSHLAWIGTEEVSPISPCWQPQTHRLSLRPCPVMTHSALSPFSPALIIIP